MRRCASVVALAVLVACLYLTGCSPSSPSAPGRTFVTWDGKTTIPFIYSVDRTFFLGVWDLVKGTVSFSQDPLFSLEGDSSRVTWDGGDRFAFAQNTVKQLNSRIRVENANVSAPDTWAGPGCLIAAPSSSDAVFIAYMDSEGKPVLEIRNSPFAGRIVLPLPKLPPETSLLGPVAIEAGKDRVAVYFETSGKQAGGSGGFTFVQGILRTEYRPEFSAPPQWRVVNPDVPAFVAGSGTRFTQFTGQIVMSTQGRRPEILDLATGEVSQPVEFEEELKKADAGYRDGDSADRCFGYGKYRIINVNYFDDASGNTVSHVFAFDGDTLAGRIECAGDSITVFGNGSKTSEVKKPEGASLFQFPQDVEQPVVSR